MLDPFILKPIPFLSHLTDKIQHTIPYVGFQTLDLHIHEVLLCAAFYHFSSSVLSPYISRQLFPNTYNKFARRNRINWDIHVTSLIQSTFVSIAALYVIFNDEERKSWDYVGRVWGYTGASGMVQGFACGYFLWDLWISLIYVDLFGVALLAHAVSAFLVYILGYRVFCNYYGPVFILYELSSPFLNFHWFFDKLDMTGSTPQFINGIILMTTFFGCRLVWGVYQTVRVYQDIWMALSYQNTVAGRAWLDGGGMAASVAGNEASREVWKYSNGATLPYWLITVYLLSNAILTTLNIYWFNQMVAAIRKRFDPPFGTREKEDTKKDANTVMGRGLDENGTKSVEIGSTEVRRRQPARVISDYPPPNI